MTEHLKNIETIDAKYGQLDECLQRPNTGELSKCPECYKETGKWTVYEYQGGREWYYPHLSPISAQQALCARHGGWMGKTGSKRSRKKYIPGKVRIRPCKIG
jgi:hypothetical protein